VKLGRDFAAVFRLDLAEVVRSRWLAVCLGLYTLLAAIFIAAGLRESGVVGFTGLGRVLFSLCHTLVLLLPLVALVATGQVVNRARDEGTLELLMSQPIRRERYLIALLAVRLGALVLPLVGLFALLALAWLRGARGQRRVLRRAPSWTCGAPTDARAQYTALGLTKPLRLVFEPVLRSTRELDVLEEGSPYFARRLRYRSAVPAVFEKWLYQPFVQAVVWTSEQARRLQTGSLHLYLAYLLATLVGLLLWGR